MNLKPTVYWFSARSLHRTLALFIALSTVITSASLFGKDHEGKDKNKTRDRQQDQAEGQSEDVNAKTDPEKFIRHVAHSGKKEIRVANLAKERAQSQEVKQFAELLIQDHTKVNNELKLIAQHQNVPWDMTWDITAEKTPATADGTARSASTLETATPKTTINEKEPVGAVESAPAAASVPAPGAYAVNDAGSNAPDQRDPYDRLVGLTGKSFEDAYLSHEVECHSKAVAKFEKANRDLPEGELRQFVQSTLPALRHHLAMAKRMAPADANRPSIRERSDREYNTDRAANSPEDQDKANK